MRTDSTPQPDIDALRSLHRDVLDEPLPEGLLSAARRVDNERRRQRHMKRWTATVLSVALAFGGGWLTHAQWNGSTGRSEQPLASANGVREFVRQASYAHAVYLPEKRHPVEVAAAEQAHLVQWLSKRLGKSLHVPDLSAQGFDLVGGRLLPGDTGPRAQFMFQQANGTRITLYLGGVTDPAQAAALKETRFRFDTNGPVNSFYWFDQDFGYALSGQVDRPQLLTLATAVYQQIEPPR